MLNRAALIAFSCLAAVACSGEGGPKSAEAPAAPAAVQNVGDAKLAAVLTYADWCSSCKILDPKLRTVKAETEFPGTAFVTLDYTARDGEAMFKAADAAGVGEAVRAHLADEIKTGLLLLVDVDDKKVLDVVRKNMSEAEITAAIAKAAGAA